MRNPWKRDKAASSSSSFLPSQQTLALLLAISLCLLLLSFLYPSSNPNPSRTPSHPNVSLKPTKIRPFDCYASPQASPVVASLVEGVKYPFLFSLSDFGTLPEKPHKNIQRVLKGKLFRKPDISGTVQGLLEGRKPEDGNGGVVVDVGSNVGMAAFAAAAMGFQVVAFEPIFENLQRICDGVYLNRVADRVTLFGAAASDRIGEVTIHKVVGRLDNSAISQTGAKLAFKSNQEIAVTVPTIPLDEVISETQKVLLIKIDVQGWEYHVLKGALKILSRRKGEAPYLIYEEDERLLQASNTTMDEIRSFLGSVGYNSCTKHGTDAHCTKD